jgi:HSP20 family protein
VEKSASSARTATVAGEWFQCAYGAFRREIALPAKVLVEQASATYKNGVLRVEIPKAEPGQTKPHTIKVD